MPLVLHVNQAPPSITQSEPITPPPGIQVHVSGALGSPGVYTVAPGTKIHELLAKLDISNSANTQHLNLAQSLRDGQKITIQFSTPHQPVVNVNTASKRQLMALPGIGPTLAQKIINIRSSKGSIETMAELSAIIGQKKAAAIQHDLRF